MSDITSIYFDLYSFGSRNCLPGLWSTREEEGRVTPPKESKGSPAWRPAEARAHPTAPPLLNPLKSI